MNPYINTNAGIVRAGAIKGRSINQHQRVASGLESGAITGTELASLKGMKQDAVASLNQAKQSGGTVNLRERAALHQDLNQLSDAIFVYKWN